MIKFPTASADFSKEIEDRAGRAPIGVDITNAVCLKSDRSARPMMTRGITAWKQALPVWMCLFTPCLAFAGAEAVIYDGPHDIAEDWARTIGLSLAAISAGLIVYTLIFRRKRLMEPQSKWLLFLGVCVAPVPVSLLSTAVGLEQSKRVDFCSSCHVMEPFVEDMRDADSDTLAAIHYRNRYIPHEQCYNCHSDYGIFGTMQAKMSGLGHVWKESTKSYELPIKIRRPYNFMICLNCHGQAAPFLGVEGHQDAVKALLAGESNCMECHDEIHPPREDRSE